MVKYLVYVHISPNKKYYVGVTSFSNPNIRWKNGYGYTKNKYFFNAIKKYGWDNFKHEIVAKDLTKEEAYNLEKILIKKLKSNDWKFGYNNSSGGEKSRLGVKASPETLEKMRYINLGKHFSEETRRKISEGLKGRPCSEETRLKIRNSQIGKRVSNETRMKLRKSHIGIRQSEETKRKRADANRGKKRSEEIVRKMIENSTSNKKVFNVSTKEIFNSAGEAARKYSLNFSNLCSCCRGERLSCGGYKWKYYEEGDELYE